MLRKIASLLLSLVLVAGVVFSVPVSVKAASSGSESGRMMDTSSPKGGYVDWVYTYSGGKAKLTLSGNGYMPNGTDQDWFAAEQRAGCYIYEVEIKNGVKSIMENAFAGEIHLSTVTLPESIEFVGENAFAYTPLKSLNIPKKMGEIRGNIFTGSSIKSFIVDSANPYYKSYYGDIYSKDMTELVVAAPGKFADSGYDFSIPQKVKSIGEFSFYCTNVENITIPSNVIDVKKMAFAGCQKLSDVVIEHGVRRFYDSVFLSCQSLKEIHLPASVDYIGYCTFGYKYSVDLEGLAQMLDDKGISYLVLTESNYATYAAMLGYSADAFTYCHPDPDFTLYAPVNSAGQNYATNFDVNYIKASVLSKLSNKTNGISVKWSYSDEVLYSVLYKKTDGGPWEEVESFYEGETSYVDTDVTPREVYSYSLKVVYLDGNDIWDTGGMSYRYLTPVNLKTATNVFNGVRVEWKAQSDVTGYYVYRKAKGESSWSYIANVKKATYYVDKDARNNKIYEYNVRSYKDGSSSAMGNTNLNTTFVKAPEFTVYNTVKGISVKWEAVTGAKSYKVFRKIPGGSWKLLKIVDGKKTVYSDTSTARGTTYQYAVRAVNGNYVSGFLTKTINSIAAPMSLKIKNTNKGVSVSWNKCAGASGYYVFRKNASGKWVKIATIKGNNNLSFVDKNVNSGIFYTYRVKAYSGSYLSTYDLDGIKIRFLAAPIIDSAVSTQTGIKLKINPVKGSKGYYVLRKTGSGAWSRIYTITNPNNLIYTDKTAKKGKTYIYTIKAYNGDIISGYYYKGAEVKDIY